MPSPKASGETNNKHSDSCGLSKVTSAGAWLVNTAGQVRSDSTRDKNTVQGRQANGRPRKGRVVNEYCRDRHDWPCGHQMSSPHN